MHMIHSKKFSGKKILLVDKDQKQSNDRTWCFWEKGGGLFEYVVHKRWDCIWFHGNNYSKEISLSLYQYKMIRGKDFYDYCLSTILQQSNFEIIFENIDSAFSDINTGVEINGTRIFCDWVFNSILREKPKLGRSDLWLLQHFKGWLVQTEENVFNPFAATLMDFRTDQTSGTSFCYVLPFTQREALIEYTMFSEAVTDSKHYDGELKSYIRNILGIDHYRIIDEEFGVIPMTNYKFPSHQNRIINIGTAGGRTKSSTGYTFQFIQKHSAAIVERLVRAEKPILNPPSRFNFYDSVLLKVLSDQKIMGSEIFTELFKNNPIEKIFGFLDNESTLIDEAKIIASLPTFPFLKAGIKQIVGN